MRTGWATPVGDRTWMLGEGPAWDESTDRVYWVDILGRRLLTGRWGESAALARGTVDLVAERVLPAYVSALATTPTADILLALQDRLVVVGEAGDEARQVGPTLLPSESGRRLNDGAADPAGRFLVGSLRMSGPSNSEELFQVDLDGSIRVLDDDLRLSNGVAWSVDGRRMYSVDSLAGVVWVRDYEVRTGDVGAREPFLRVDDGIPDGLAVDAAGCLWVAIWGKGEVRRYSPGGAPVERILTGAPHTSNLAFVGPRLDHVVITTARAELSTRALVQHPNSGRVFIARVEVPGAPTHQWRGSVGS